MSKQLQQKARDLLENKKVDVIIGHGTGSTSGRTRPVFITSADKIETLTLEGTLANNLANFLTRPEVKKLGRMAIVARPKEIKTIVGLIQESQLTPDQVIIIGVKFDQHGNPDKSGEIYNETTIDEYINILKEKFLPFELNAEMLKEVNELEAMGEEKQWQFWQEQFSRCIKCYACRQACPLCYCNRCVVEKNQPQWIDTSTHPKGQYSWNFTRAFHLAGRCISCDACYSACPMNIPLYLLNRQMAKKVKELFGYVAGYNYNEDPPLSTFKPDDKEDFVK